MKKYIILITTITTLSCKAQYPILTLDADNYGTVENAYYKDTTNFLDQFVGVWLYTNGNTQFKIVLQKKELFYMNVGPTSYYTDYIIGGYQYIAKGTEQVNTLGIDNELPNFNNIFDYNIYGNIRKHNNNTYPKCNECTVPFERLKVRFFEPSRRNVEGLDAQMVFRRFTEGGVEKLKVWFYMTSSSFGYLTDGSPTNIDDYSIPFGEYIMIKQ